ncbi:MAG TPA: LpxD N-terminal domain-containing protein, partial [Casimicrobiaceae bacterium]|nr:LpxD N-terminal domain-containing protein [Casimicrobiaceae bacterium]
MNAPLASGHLLSELAARTGSRVAGDDIRVERVGTLEHAQPGSITFVTSARYRTKLHDTRASAVIVSEADADITTLPRLISANPYATYARVAAILHV